MILSSETRKQTGNGDNGITERDTAHTVATAGLLWAVGLVAMVITGWQRGQQRTLWPLRACSGRSVLCHMLIGCSRERSLVLDR